MIAAILENPDRDDRRLAYAHRLIDEGDEFGKFVERQLQAERSPEGPFDELPHDADQPDERRFLANDLAAALVSGTFYRGFVEYACVLLNGLGTRGQELFDAFPILRRLYVRAESGGFFGRSPIRAFAAFVEADGFSRIERLRFSTGDWKGVGDKLAEALARLPRESRLRELEGVGLSRSGLESLLTSPQLPALSSLRIPDVAREHCEPMIEHGSRLENLWLWSSLQGGLDGHAIERMSAAPALHGLRWLRLTGNPIGERGGEALAHSSQFAALEFLDVQDQSAKTVVELIASPQLPRLRTLLAAGTLPRKGYRQPGPLRGVARALAGASPTHSLDRLDIFGALIGDAGVQLLCDSPFLLKIELKELGLGGNEITAAGAKCLANSPSVRGLKRLSLVGNHLSDEAKELLRRSEHLQHCRLELQYGFEGAETAARRAQDTSQ